VPSYRRVERAGQVVGRERTKERVKRKPRGADKIRGELGGVHSRRVSEVGARRGGIPDEGRRKTIGAVFQEAGWGDRVAGEYGGTGKVGGEDLEVRVQRPLPSSPVKSETAKNYQRILRKHNNGGGRKDAFRRATAAGALPERVLPESILDQWQATSKQQQPPPTDATGMEGITSS